LATTNSWTEYTIADFDIVFSVLQVANAGDDVLVFYNDHAFSTLQRLMKEERDDAVSLTGELKNIIVHSVLIAKHMASRTKSIHVHVHVLHIRTYICICIILSYMYRFYTAIFR
jgi:hypothetical protein